VEWLSLRDAVFTAFTSTNAEVIHVNNYQRREFARYGIVRRDPLYVTLSALIDVEEFTTPDAFQEHVRCALCRQHFEQKAEAQWLHNDATAEQQVAEVYNS
jgi:hypothetical protein